VSAGILEQGRVGIGLVGTGFLANARARCWRRIAGGRAVVRGVAGRSVDKARAFAERHTIENACSDFEALLGLDEVHAVDLCVPNSECQ
jgi:predicted dehydrogenase